MNLASQGGDPNSELIFVNFNQDRTSLAVGTKTGYKLFSLNSVDKLENIYSNESEDICTVERLFSSSLVAVVSLSAPRKLKVCHFKKGTEICNYSYSNTILAVHLNRLRLVVCLEESLYIHNIRDMKVLHTIRDTPPNPSGLCALSISNDNCYLAYPGSNQVGEVQIFDTVNLRAVTMIPAHDNPLVAMAFNSTGTRIATASEKGTVIRVFSIPDGQKLFEFRRGVKRCVSIYSLAFSADSLFLCCSSNTETVHIFKLENTKDRPSEEPQGWMGYFGQALKSSANYLPSQVTEVFNQGRDFAIARLPFSGLVNVCALTIIQKLPRLLVVCQDGYLYIYNVDPMDGGECTLLKQHRVDGREDTASTSERPGKLPATDQPLSGQASDLSANTKQPPEGSTKPNHQQASWSASATGAQGKAAGWKGAASYAKVVKSDAASAVPPPASSSSSSSPPGCSSLVDALCDEEPVPEISADDIDEQSSHMNAIRLDDEDEFPPMTQKSD